MQVAYRRGHEWGHSNIILDTYPTMRIPSQSNSSMIIDTKRLLFKPISLNESSHPSLSSEHDSNSDSVIDKSGLLFKPVSLSSKAQMPPITEMPELLSYPSAAIAEDEWELWSMLTQPLEAVAQHRWSPVSLVSVDALPQVLDHHFQTEAVASRDMPDMLTLVRPASKQSKRNSGSMRELLFGILGTGAVVTAYMITPLVTTLIPVLPNDWSRLLMALEILGVGEFIICRILVKTTKKERYISS